MLYLVLEVLPNKAGYYRLGETVFSFALYIMAVERALVDGANKSIHNERSNTRQCQSIPEPFGFIFKQNIKVFKPCRYSSVTGSEWGIRWKEKYDVLYIFNCLPC